MQYTGYLVTAGFGLYIVHLINAKTLGLMHCTYLGMSYAHCPLTPKSKVEEVVSEPASQKYRRYFSHVNLALPNYMNIFSLQACPLARAKSIGGGSTFVGSIN